MKYYIGIDLGGTNIKVGIVDENYNIISKSEVKTNLPRPAVEIVDDIKKCCYDALDKANLSIDNVESIGIGTPGVVNPYIGVVIFASNMQFNYTPLKDLLTEKMENKPVYLENDANVAAYGEYINGAGKGHNTVVAVTLGTGVGGGIIIDGQIFSGANHCGAELGHTVIEKDGRPCGCGRRGCLETYASATAIINQTKKIMEENKNSKLWELVDGDITKVNGKTAFDGMRLGYEDGAAIVLEFLEYLGCGLANFVNIFQPEILILGGAVSKEGDNITKPLIAIIDRESYCVEESKKTILKASVLGNDAAIIGAAYLHKLYK